MQSLHRNLERQQALLILLQYTRPLAGLEKIGYKYRLARDPRRSPEVIKRDLGRAYVEHRKQDWTDPSEIVSVRRRTRAVHLVRSA